MPTLTSKSTLHALTPRFLLPFWTRLEASPIGCRLARGAFWSFTGAVLSRGLGLVAGILVARMLGKHGFGELGIIQGTLGMFGCVAGFGLGVTATKYVAECRDSDPNRASRVISLSAVVSWGTGTLAALGLFLSAPWLARNTLAAPHLGAVLQIASLMLLFDAVNGAQTGALAGFEAFKRIAQLSFWTGLASFILLPIGCWLFGLPGAAGGLVVSRAAGCAVNRWGLAREARRFRMPLWSTEWKSELPILWRFSLPAVLAALLVAPVLWYSQTLLVKQPAGYQGMAEYSVGVQWRMLVQYLPGLLCAAYLPVFSSLPGSKRLANRRRLVLNMAAVCGGTTLLTALPVFLGSSWILAAYGPGFGGARWVLGLMLLAGAVDSANSICVQTLMGANRAWLRLISNGIWALVQSGVALAIVPKYGAFGLALSVCAAQVTHLAIQSRLVLVVCRKES